MCRLNPPPLLLAVLTVLEVLCRLGVQGDLLKRRVQTRLTGDGQAAKAKAAAAATSVCPWSPSLFCTVFATVSNHAPPWMWWCASSG